MFHVVEFDSKDGGGVSVVREVWLTPRKNECWWPPYKNSSQFNKALESHEQPNDRWAIYGVKRIFYETDDLKKAREKCKKAETESDVLTEIEDGHEKRKRKQLSQKLQFSSDSSDCTDIEIPYRDTIYPKPPSSRRVHTFLTKHRADQSNDHESCETQNERSQPKEQNEPVQQKVPYTLGEDSCATTPKQNRILEAQSLDVIAKHLAQIEHKLDGLKICQDEILRRLPADVTTPINLPSDLKIPCETIEELNNLEIWLESEDNKKNLEMTLSLVGGNKISSTVRRILERLFTNTLAGGCNWTGKNKKTSLKNLRVIQTIQGAVRRNRVTEKATDAEIQNAVSSWFRFTRDRDGGREERRRAKQQDQ